MYSSKGAILYFIHMFFLDLFYICKSVSGNLILVRFIILHRAREAIDNMAPRRCDLHSD